MPDNIINFAINVEGNAASGIAQINTQVNQLNKNVDDSQSLLGKIGKFALDFNNIATTISSVTGKMQEFAEANRIQQVAETKLASVMNNTMGASQSEIDSIKELASEQQKLGVIGDEVQLAGAKELSIHLKKADTLKSLIPAMNDYIAANDGLDASQASAESAAAMLGKAMDGNLMMMQRAGFVFSDAQKKIMETGTEEERAATLAEVLNSKVGGVNEALAATPEGKVQQAANNFGDLKEKIGNVYVKLQSALAPAINTCVNAFDDFKDIVDKFWPIIVGVTGAIVAFTIAANASAISMKLNSIWTNICGAATAVLNAIQAASPITWVIVSVIALIGVITFLCLKIKGWGTLWDAVTTFAKETFYAFVDRVKLDFTTVVNGIMIGIDKIKEGWYKFKLAIGLGDENENKKMLDEIQGDIKKRADEIAEAANKEKEHIENAIHAWDGVNMGWDDSVTLKSTTDKLKKQLGITDETQQTINEGDDTKEGDTNVNQDLSDASTTISSGGKNVRNFNITINDGLVNGVQNYFNASSDDPSSASDFMWRLSNALQMILNDANYAAQ